MRKHFSFATLLALLIAFCASVGASAQAGSTITAKPAAGEWKFSQHGTNRQLDFEAAPSAPGKRAMFSVRFIADPHSDKQSTGVVGVEIYFNDLAPYQGFDFNSFEGPDAPASAKKLVKFTINAKGKAPLEMRFTAAGWYPQGETFAFGMVEVSGKAGSPQKALIRALAAGAETLQVTIVDFRDARRSIELLLPVTGQGADFARLLEGMRR